MPSGHRSPLGACSRPLRCFQKPLRSSWVFRPASAAMSASVVWSLLIRRSCRFNAPSNGATCPTRRTYRLPSSHASFCQHGRRAFRWSFETGQLPHRRVCSSRVRTLRPLPSPLLALHPMDSRHSPDACHHSAPGFFACCALLWRLLHAAQHLLRFLGGPADLRRVRTCVDGRPSFFNRLVDHVLGVVSLLIRLHQPSDDHPGGVLGERGSLALSPSKLYEGLPAFLCDASRG